MNVFETLWGCKLLHSHSSSWFGSLSKQSVLGSRRCPSADPWRLFGFGKPVPWNPVHISLLSRLVVTAIPKSTCFGNLKAKKTLFSLLYFVRWLSWMVNTKGVHLLNVGWRQRRQINYWEGMVDATATFPDSSSPKCRLKLPKPLIAFYSPSWACLIVLNFSWEIQSLPAAKVNSWSEQTFKRKWIITFNFFFNIMFLKTVVILAFDPDTCVWFLSRLHGKLCWMRLDFYLYLTRVLQ